MKITIKEILNNHGIGGKLEENTTKDLEVLFKSERERLARDMEDRLDEAIYNNMDISGIREDVLKIIQANKGEGVREVRMNYKKLLNEINKEVDNDWGYDMVDGHIYFDKNTKPYYKDFTQKEAQEMAQTLGRIYRISHTIHCKACRS